MKRIYKGLLCLLLCAAVLCPSCTAYADTEELSVIDPAELDALMEDFIAEHEIDGDNISIGYCYTATGERWYYNRDKWYYAGSMYKVPLMMLMAEKVKSGEITEDTDVEIREEDLKVDTYRSGGAGGQHVNKTESAIRITHIPTGIVVACQNERSQHQNREVAMKMLKSKLVEIKEREHLDKIEDIKGVQKEIAWGSQIRSYVFMPYTLVKDHRTGFESGNVSAVMDGDLDGFINAYLKSVSLGQIGK